MALAAGCQKTSHASKLEDKDPVIKVAVGQSRGKAVSDLARLTENVAQQSSEDPILIIKPAHILEICLCQHKLAVGKYL